MDAKIPMYIINKKGEYISNPEYLSMSLSSLREKHEELKRLAPNAKYFAQKCAQLMEKVSDLDEQIKSLEEKLRKKEEQIKQLKDNKEQTLIPVEGAVVLQIDGKLKGCYVKQHTYMNKIEELKRLKEKYDNEIWIKTNTQRQDI